MLSAAFFSWALEMKMLVTSSRAMMLIDLIV
jgi:hypothetical protein